MSRALALVAFALLGLAYAWHVLATFGGHTIDDAGITYAYADNLAHGRGLRLTPGEAPTEGFSNFLEVLALAPFARAGDVDRVAKVLNVGCATAGLLLLVIFLDRKLRGPARIFAAVPLLQAFLWPGFNYWTAAGLEGGLLAGLQMASLVALGWEADVLLGVTAGLLVWVRPEGFVYGAVVVAARWIARRERGRVLATALFLGACLLLAIIRLAVFRDLVPNTYWAKAGTRSHRDGLVYVWQFLSYRGWYFLYLFPFLAVLARGPMVLAAAGQLLFAFYFPIQVGGDWMREWRFLQPAMGPLAALGAVGLLALGPVARPWRAALLLLPSLSIAVIPPGWRGAARRVDTARDIDLRVLTEVAGHYRDLGERLHLGRRLLHLDVDAGGVSYRSGLDTIDMSGLTDRVLARGWNRESGLVVDYLYGERRPDTIHLHASWLTGTPVQLLSPFGWRYRAFAPSTLLDMRLSPVSAVRGDVLDPPAAPVVPIAATVGGAELTGLSAVRTAAGYALYVHGRQAGKNDPRPLVWTDAAGGTHPAVWHAGIAVAAGPPGSVLLASATLPVDALPLSLGDTGVRLERWPEVAEDLRSLAGLSRLALARMVGRMAGAARPACDPAPLLSPDADAPSQARGVAFISELCGGLPDAARDVYRDRAWAAARAADGDDRYEAAVAALRLGRPQTVTERLFVESARRGHQRYDEVLATWAERDLAGLSRDPAAIRSGLALLLAARQEGEVVLRALALGWSDLAEARGPLCGAVRRMGLRPETLGLACAAVAEPRVVVVRQDFESAADPNLTFLGRSRRWLASAGPPGGERIAGGQGTSFLSSRPRDPRELVDGEVVWGPLPLPGRRFGALLGGAVIAVVEVKTGDHWVELWRSAPPPFDTVMSPQVGALRDRRGQPARVRVLRARAGQGEILADALTFVDVPDP